MRYRQIARTGLVLFTLACVTLCSPLAALPGTTVLAQNPNGRLVITVKDQSGAVISAATVTVLNNGTAEQVTAPSNESGTVTFPQLGPGEYTVTVEAANFQKSVFEQVKIEVGKEYSLVAELGTGPISETVTVTAGESIVSTTNAELITTVTPRQVQDLPLDGRDPLQLIQLQAGVTIDNGRGGVTVNGQRTSSGIITQDGIPVQDFSVRENALSFSPNRTTVSGISEFSVTTQNAGPDQSGASTIRLVTPSGTNSLHGEVFEYHRNDALGANGFFNNANDVPKPQLIRNQFGFSVGGPVYVPNLYDGRDKFFFFGSYEGFRERSSSFFTTTVLTPEARAGIFQYRDTDGRIRSINVLQQVHAQVDPISAGLLARIPLPNSDLVGDQLVTSGYSFNKRAPSNRNQGTARMDYIINDRQKLEAIYQYTGELNRRPDIDATFNETPLGFDRETTHFGVLAWNWKITDTFTNEVRAGLNNTTGFFGNEESATAPYFVVFPLNTDPQVNFDPQLRRDTVASYIDDASYIVGDHFVRFGARVDRIRLRNTKTFNLTPRVFLDVSTRAPSSAIIRSLPGGTSTDVGRANSLLATLAGYINNVTREYDVPSASDLRFEPVVPVRNFEINQYALYVADQWRIHPRVTLNAGVRWDYITPLRERDNLGVLPTGSGGVGSALDPNGTLDRAQGYYYSPDKNNFGPNIGVAWDVFGDATTVVRGGFSVAFINDEAVRAVQLVGETNPGLLSTLDTGSTFGRLSVDLPRILNETLAPPPVQLPLSYRDAFAQNSQLFVAGVRPDLATPYYQQWNLSVEREVGWDTAVAVRYVGNRGRRLFSNINYNPVDVVNTGFAADVARARANGLVALERTGTFDPSYNGPGSQPLTVFPTLQFGGLLTFPLISTLISQGRAGDLADIYYSNGFSGSDIFVPNPSTYFSLVLGNEAFSNYNALQVEVRRRFSKNLGFQANYTWSKAYGFGVGTQQQRQDFPFDINNLNYDKRRLLFDTPHNFKANVTYDLPFGNGQRFSPDNRLLNGLVSGIELTSIISWYTGAPISINSNFGTFAPGSTQVNSTLTHDEIVKLFGVHDTPDGLYFIDPSVIGPTGAAVSPDIQAPFPGQVFFNPGPGELGTLQFLQFNGPTVFNWDASVIKDVALTEKVKAQFRAEVFNVLNHPIFFITSQNVNSTNFGKITSTLNSPRVVQLAVKLSF